MNPARFIQIHFLTAYPASLLNRDDAGMAKRIPFGGVSRIRISSQCLKRHWRTADGERSLKTIGVEMSVRSRMIFEKLVAEPLIAERLDSELVRPVVKALQGNLLGESERARRQEEEPAGDLQTSQVIILGWPEIDYIITATREIVGAAPVTDAGKRLKESRNENERKKNIMVLEKTATEQVKIFLSDRDRRKNLEALKRAAGLDAALFGRMVTSDILARGDAAIHVAHAFTVHAEEAESDYFTAVDDLVTGAGELGSGHIGEAELTSGLFYGYVVVDLPQLVINLEGIGPDKWQSADPTLAARVVENLIHLIVTVSPGAKLGSTAPYSFAHLVLIEAGTRQPRTLANAFLVPVGPGALGGVVMGAVRALGEHLRSLDQMYGKREERRIAALVDVEGNFPADQAGSLEKPAKDAALLDKLATWAADQVMGS